MAIVAIEAELGQGAGFFITNDGYTIIKSHVVRLMPADRHEDEARFQPAERRLKAQEAELARRRTLAAGAASNLAWLKARG